MSTPLRIELTGKDSAKWNRIFGKLVDIIAAGVEAITPDEETRDSALKLVGEIADLTKNWAKAKLQRPGLENEKLMAETLVLFEEAKLKQAQRVHQELENESLKLDLLIKRVTTAMKLLGFLNAHMFIDENGAMTLVLTNQDLVNFHSDILSLSRDPAEEAV